MARRIFIRSVQARDNLELFLVSAASSLLLLRFYLELAGYPQVGGGSLHIAHMLWGGVLMLVAIVVNLAFLGQRLTRLSALIGGVGFGIFIDEIGKFLTKDNNYFFRPAVGIIYAIFVLLYLFTSRIGRTQRLTSREYQLNALTQLEEAILNDLDSQERAHAEALLAQADQKNEITRALRTMLAATKTVHTNGPSRRQRFLSWFDRWYQRLWRSRSSNTVVNIFFLGQMAVFGLGVLYALGSNADAVRDVFEGTITYGRSLVFGQLLGTVIAAIFAILGALRLVRSRVEGFEFFRRATLTNLLFTEFFIFSRIQFGAMPSFIFNLVMLFLITLVLTQERRVGH